MALHRRKRRGRRGILLGVGILGFGGLAAALAAGATSGAGALSLVLQPNHSFAFSSGPKASATGAVGWESSNWSGYAETSSSPYTSVSGQWTVPTVTGPNNSYSAAWVGIDGFNDDYLIQTGTEQDYSSGSGQYSAWWTTSSQDFEEQTITSGCTTSAAPNSGTVNDSVGTRSATSRSGAPFGANPFSARGTTSPSASTGSASNVTSSTATLNGTVNPNGTATDYYFEYGPTTSYGFVTSTESAGSGRSAVSVSANIGSLSASTTYYFQLVAFNSRYTVDGGRASFATSSSGGSSGGGSCGTVEPGDTMSATISESNASTSTWMISLSDTTQGWTYTQSVDYTGPAASAEWILEAPSLCNGSRCTIATLADYGSTTFVPDDANGANAHLTTSEGGEIVNSRGQVISIPSAPSSEGDGFTIAYGSTAPSPPSS